MKHRARGTGAPAMLAEKIHPVRRGLGMYMHRHDLVLITGGLNRASSLDGRVRQRARLGREGLSPAVECELGQGLGPRCLH